MGAVLVKRIPAPFAQELGPPLLFGGLAGALVVALALHLDRWLAPRPDRPDADLAVDGETRRDAE